MNVNIFSLKENRREIDKIKSRSDADQTKIETIVSEVLTRVRA